MQNRTTDAAFLQPWPHTGSSSPLALYLRICRSNGDLRLAQSPSSLSCWATLALSWLCTFMLSYTPWLCCCFVFISASISYHAPNQLKAPFRSCTRTFYCIVWIQQSARTWFSLTIHGPRPLLTYWTKSDVMSSGQPWPFLSVFWVLQLCSYMVTACPLPLYFAKLPWQPSLIAIASCVIQSFTVPYILCSSYELEWRTLQCFNLLFYNAFITDQQCVAQLWLHLSSHYFVLAPISSSLCRHLNMSLTMPLNLQ